MYSQHKLNQKKAKYTFGDINRMPSHIAHNGGGSGGGSGGGGGGGGNGGGSNGDDGDSNTQN